jgi:hypothetical protein
MALSTMVSLNKMNTRKTGALSNQTNYFLDFCSKTSIKAQQFSETHWVVRTCFTVRLFVYCCGGNCGGVWFQCICHISEVTFATSAYLKTIQRYILWVFWKGGLAVRSDIYRTYCWIICTESLPQWHRSVMKPLKAVSSCWEAKLSKCGVTYDREFAICVLNKHRWPQ